MPNTGQHGRAGRRWRQLRALVLSRSNICGICGKPIDMTLSGRAPMGPTVNHRRALVLGGKPYDLDNLEPAHNRCNAGAGPLEVPPVRSRQW